MVGGQTIGDLPGEVCNVRRTERPVPHIAIAGATDVAQLVRELPRHQADREVQF